jgi:pyruvate/2-oxoglutarate dehydrogenase complex dihydrolipoamide acyltransferase (E2) component
MPRFEFGLPQLGDITEDVTVIDWRKQVGDQVTQGEPLVEVETDKAQMVLDCPVSGRIVEIHAPADNDYPVGHILAVFEIP